MSVYLKFLMNGEFRKLVEFEGDEIIYKDAEHEDAVDKILQNFNIKNGDDLLKVFGKTSRYIYVVVEKK